MLWAARQSDEGRGEDWSAHYGQPHSTDEMRLVHLTHLVRSAPSLRKVSDLPVDHEVWRDHVDATWQAAPIPPA